jgi:hypothetical protein
MTDLTNQFSREDNFKHSSLTKPAQRRCSDRGGVIAQAGALLPPFTGSIDLRLSKFTKAIMYGKFQFARRGYRHKGFTDWR